ncbi:hypothetical protein OG897_40660 [Streptomyces sp. NBC_00237]|uniref:hypothetical protein n=1 Tax=Streptomyces sp. NBC_00237 TaxID=2975687 RepID=UPI0022580850|nr:hypothetical protein [Streptomyces sp. NBC_00237]MCX5207697.1 hypothetical protein [Streptomyces sp. NBC_00237]
MEQHGLTVWRVGAGTLRGLAAGAARWRQWPWAARSAARVLLPAAVAAWWWSPAVSYGVGAALVVVALAAALTGPTALRWWRPVPPTDAQLHAPGVWAAVRELLRLPESTVREEWLRVPVDLRADGARIVLRVPVEWVGGEAAVRAVEAAVAARVPGEWVVHWHRSDSAPYAEWEARVPAPPPAQLPTSVPWRPTGNRHEVFVGKALEDGEVTDVIIQTESDTPHWGVAGATGQGKSTILYIAVVHARQYGGIVDVLDTKQNSLTEADGKSGVRIHKTVSACITAFAEFMASMQAAETAKGKDADPALRALLIPRTLVVDELPTLVKFAHIWWRYVIKGKGAPPFLEWFAVAFLQGRSADHRVVVGTQQFAGGYFGGTMERAQIGWRAMVGYQDRVSWGVAYGPSVQPIPYDTTVKGRGVFADGKVKKETNQLWVREFQACYITPQVSQLLDACPPAPAWHDAGEMAPWITEQALEAAASIAVPPYLPGGKYGPPDVVPLAHGVGVAGVTGRSGQGTAVQGTLQGTAQGTAEAEGMPAVYSLAEACEEGLLPWGYETAKRYRTRSAKRGIEFPEGITDGRTSCYTEEELREWVGRWNAAGGK